MTDPGNTDNWQGEAGWFRAIECPMSTRSQKEPFKKKEEEARCNAAFLCSFWACDSYGGMDLYPSYTERAAELDGALK